MTDCSNNKTTQPCSDNHVSTRFDNMICAAVQTKKLLRPKRTYLQACVR
jgi:hypothetical protein